MEEVCRLSGLQAGKLIVENDAQATLLGVTGFKPGALLISGTGSIAFAHDGKGNIFRSGGWGHRAGDEGSGYWIGREAVAGCFQDGRWKRTYYFIKKRSVEGARSEICGRFGGLVVQTESFGRIRLAKLSRVLWHCVQTGDRVADGILVEASKELALLVKSVLQKAQLGNMACSIYLNGGAVVHAARLVVRAREKSKNRVSALSIDCFHDTTN